MKKASCFLGKMGKKKQTQTQNPRNLFFTCHERIDFHKQNFMDYALKSQPIWTASTYFQKTHSLLIPSWDNIFVSFSEKFAGLFWRKQPEWLAV